MNLGFYMPTKVIVGKDCVRENSDVFKIGKKALIVTGKNSARLSGALDDVKYALEKNNIEYVIFDKVMSNPTVECVYDGAETAMEEEVDFVIAIGGGSPMDSAKAIALLAVSDIERKNLFDSNIGNKALPMIHIPTTAGTGSEVTPYAILTNHEKQTKKSIASPCLFPTYALLDAKYTKNLGLATTVNTAIDSLSHSVEGMMSKRANIMADVIAKEAVKIIASTFDDLISGELTEDDREKLLYASMLGGVVISQTKTTAVHAMGYSLTYFKNIDHGRANGLLLGEFTKYIERNDKDRVKEILSCMNLDSAEEFKKADKLPLVVILDDIRSLHNIGSVFRTSDAFRIECIYLCGITATPPHPEMHKTALGAEFTVNWKYVNNAVDAVDNLRKEGYIVYSVEQAEGSIMLDELKLDKTKKYAIVMGNEVKGVQQEVIDHSDGCIEIPQYGTKHSLNVSVTAGIVIWELFIQLKA